MTPTHAAFIVNWSKAQMRKVRVMYFYGMILKQPINLYETNGEFSPFVTYEMTGCFELNYVLNYWYHMF